MYKKIHAQYIKRNTYKIHLWDEGGYDLIEWNNPAYIPTSNSNTPYRGLKGELLEKTYKWHKDETPNLHFHDMPPYQKFLIEKYGTKDNPSTGHVELFFDIEIEMGDSLTPEFIGKAPKKITSIAFYDKSKKQWGLFIIDPEKKINPLNFKNKNVVPCKNEKELLSKWIERFREIDPDIIIGFNSNYFDIPYMYFRICRVLGQEWADFLSPIGIVQDSSGWDYNQVIKIAGVESLDYLTLHKKYYWRDEPQWNLGFLGKKYTSLGKVEYEGSLDILYKKDINKFIEYNFRDVEIILKLDEHFGYIELTKRLSHKGKIKYEDVLSNSKIHDGAISSYLLSKNIIPPGKDLFSAGRSYAGGYLFCEKPGLQKYIADFDLVSLYPSIIRSLNLGKDTYVARILWEDSKYNKLGLKDLKERDPDEVLRMENEEKKQATIKVKDLIQVIEDGNLSISANGVMFRKNKKSALSEVLEKWYNERTTFKNKMKEAFKSGKKKEGNKYYLEQYTNKILLNSAYGTLALSGFRYGNIIFAEAITLTGQRVIQDSARFLNGHLNNM